MRLIVQKFGGTSVTTGENRKLVVGKILAALKEGFTPVVVVSAMGRKGDNYATDTLLSLVENMSVAKREIDQLMCCGEMISAVVLAAALQTRGIDAPMLTGGQAGIYTDENYGEAGIVNIDVARLLTLVNNGAVPVVCGFQGVSINGNLTTLGRGGSDTTAAALGAALNAERVEIYTDVDGIMTADPKIVGDARVLDRISYGEVCQLAYQGAKVIHPRAVEIAMHRNVPLVIKSTFSDAPGTVISAFGMYEHDNNCEIIDQVATGITYLRGICQLKIENVDSNSTVDVFNVLAERGISVDLINVYPEKLVFTIGEEHKEAARTELAALGFDVRIMADCAKVSVVGGGMRGVPGVMATIIATLVEHGITILQTVDSHTSISVLLKVGDVENAVQALHDSFNLTK